MISFGKWIAVLSLGAAVLVGCGNDGGTGGTGGSGGAGGVDGSWAVQTSGTTNDLHGVSFTDANNGTVVGDDGTILRTTNGGG
jgi:hypothetical protein